jgi:hypothetical protein
VIIELTAESELMPVQVDAPTFECDALHLQPQPLLERILARHTDSASSADHTMPWQSMEGVEGSDHLPGGSRKSGREGDLSIGRDLSAGNLPNLAGEDG